MVTASRFFGLGLLLLPAATAWAQNSYNWWDARPPAPVVAPPRPTPTRKAAPAVLGVSAATDSLPLTTGGYTRVEVMPSFPGGQEAFLKHITSQLKRPKGPQVSGTLYITYTVLASGAVANVHVASGRGLSPAYDAAVVEAVSKIRSFTPGKRNGAAADIEVTIPIAFP